MVIVFVLLSAMFIYLSKCTHFYDATFPDDFCFGAASSAYQIEGGWNANGKGENVWDRSTHTKPAVISDGRDADVACDSYNKVHEDVALLKELGVQIYRFSVSWTRILPRGFSYKVNLDGVRYYNELINLLLLNNITPMVTMFHWDTPHELDVLGAFYNSEVVGWFEQYAKVLFEHFGDRVKLWWTFNDPAGLCFDEKSQPPKTSVNGSRGIREYMCVRNVLNAHAAVYRLYKAEFYAQNAKIGIILDGNYYEPEDGSSRAQAAAQYSKDFMFGLFADPIFLPSGNYPKSVLVKVAKSSKLEGLDESRLNELTPREIGRIRDSADFIGLNYFSTRLVGAKKANNDSFLKDFDVLLGNDRNVASGLKKMLDYVGQRYKNYEIHLTGIGYADQGSLDDKKRIEFHRHCLKAVVDCIHVDKIKIKSYTIWSLMDSFEWTSGYGRRFGLYHVDFNAPEKNRTAKASALFYKDVVDSKSIVVSAASYLSFRKTGALILLCVCTCVTLQKKR